MSFRYGSRAEREAAVSLCPGSQSLGLDSVAVMRKIGDSEVLTAASNQFARRFQLSPELA